MSIWAVLTAIVCLALCVKLTFFTETDRCNSRWPYRVILFLSNIAFASRFIDIVYSKEPGSFWEFGFFSTLLAGSFMVRYWHLPWNAQR